MIIFPHEKDWLKNYDNYSFEYFNENKLSGLPIASALGIADAELLSYYDHKYDPENNRFVLQLDHLIPSNYERLEDFVAEASLDVIGEKLDPVTLSNFNNEFTEKLDEIDKIYAEKRPVDEKTYQFLCFALSIKARSKPCVLKHFKGALEAGATVKELTYILALTMREAAGADDCWTHDVIGEWKEILKGNVSCCCAGDEEK